MSFALSKILWMIFSPGSMLTLLLGLGVLMERSARFAIKRAGRGLILFVFFCFALIGVFPVGEWALIPLENRYAFDSPQRVDGIIALGGDEKAFVSDARGQPTAFDSMRRYVTFSVLAKRYPEAKLAFSGGPASRGLASGMTDSIVAEETLISLGVPPDRMVFERNSRNTYENALYSASVLHPTPAQKWLLVTSAWHMPRAMSCFRKAGWNVAAAPTGYFTTGRYSFRPVFQLAVQLDMLTMAAHEYVGLVAYKLMGRTDALWP